MTALLSPAVGSSMQREMEARLANANASMSASNSASASLAAVTGMKSPVAPYSGFGNTPTFPSSPGFLGPDNPAAADGSSGFGSPSAQLAAQRNRNRQQNRISAPGNLHHLSGDGFDGNARNAGYLASGHLGDLIERGHSPGGDSNASNASRSPNLGAIGSDTTGRPKSADFATLAAAAAAVQYNQEQGKSPFARSSNSPRLGSSALGGTSAHSTPEAAMQAQAQQAMVGLGLPAAATQALNQHLTVASSPSFADQFSPLLHTNWASIGNTPMMTSFNPNEFAGNSMTSDPHQLAAQLAALSASSPALHGSPGGRVVLEDASKFRRTPSGGRPPGAQASPRPDAGHQPAYASHNWRSPMLGSGPEYGQQPHAGLNGLGIGMGMGMGMNQYDSGLTGLGVGMPSGMAGARGPPRQSSRTNNARKSPMIGGYQTQPVASSAVAASNGGAGSGAGVGGADDVDERILKDTANWLRVLRLHVSPFSFPPLRCVLTTLLLQKYTPNFADDAWRDMVMMDSDTLESRGVAALGARRKLLRVRVALSSFYPALTTCVGIRQCS